MKLGDIAKAITAEDLIRRYDLNSLKKDRKAVSVLKDGLTKTNANLENYVEVVTKDLEELHNQVDGNISQWSFPGVPSPSTPPANEWIEEEDKINHIGDLYYDEDTGYAYRWVNTEGIFQWEEVKDKGVREALALANDAMDMADNKRRIFVPRVIDETLIETPVTPYDVGDIWIYRGEIYRCVISRAEGEWNTADWVNDLKYTDDTKANQAITDLGQFKKDVEITYVPNKIFTETANSINSTIQAVQVEVAKKNTIFREQPTPPYIEGDVWIQNEKVYVCVTPRAEGDFELTDWELDLDNTQYATKTQIEQTDSRITLVAESVNGKLDEKDLISKINVSPEAIELTSDRFSLDSTHLDIAKDGSITMKGGTQDNPVFSSQTEDGTREVKVGHDFIIFENDKGLLVSNLREDGMYSEYVRAESYERNLSCQGNILAETYYGDVFETSYISIDDNGAHQSKMSSKELIVDNQDVLNRYGNAGINIKGEIGVNASGNEYIRGNLEDGKRYQLVATPKGIMYEHYNGTDWDTLWGDSGWSNIPLASGVTAGTITGTPKYRKAMNKVDIKGSFSFTKASGSLLLGTLPAGFRPPEQFYFFAPLGGTRIARFYINASGQIYCEWIYDITTGSAYTGSVAWTSINVSFYVD